MSAYCFNRYFSLEEAVSLIPDVRFMLEQAHRELSELQDAVILNKRLIMTRQSSGRKPTDAEVAVLQLKFDAFEEAVNRWVQTFAEQGIILRDIETGLIDFPYQAQSSGEEFLLCWRLNEDGIFYFHGVNDGFAGRHPSTLLPD